MQERVGFTHNLEDLLHIFFAQLKTILPSMMDCSTLKFVPGKRLDIDVMRSFFEELAQPLYLAKRAGFFCNPWVVAQLKRDEVRNSAVLAWWLDPNETHGLSDAFLSHLLQKIENENHLGLPKGVSRNCRVRVESCPDGDRVSRVDIEIDDPGTQNFPGFFLIIEVKIDAQESHGQLSRYCDISKRRGGNRKSVVLFLTPQGRRSRLMSENSECSLMHEKSIVSISWKEMAMMLKTVAKQHMADFKENKFSELELVSQLARSFSNHIIQF